MEWFSEEAEKYDMSHKHRWMLMGWADAYTTLYKRYKCVVCLREFIRDRHGVPLLPNYELKNGPTSTLPPRVVP